MLFHRFGGVALFVDALSLSAGDQGATADSAVVLSPYGLSGSRQPPESLATARSLLVEAGSGNGHCRDDSGTPGSTMRETPLRQCHPATSTPR